MNRELERLFDRFADPRAEAREAARQALVEAGSTALPILMQGLESDERQIQWESAKALFSIRDPESADALAATLADDDLDVRWICAEALIAMGLTGLRAAIRRLTRSSTGTSREAATIVISRFEASQQLAVGPLLERIRGGAPVEAVMVAAGEALEKLTPEP